MQKKKSISIAVIAMLFLTVCSMGAIGIGGTTAPEIDTTEKATISINLIPLLDGEEYEGALFVFVHDLSTTPSTRVLIKNLSMPGIVEFEINLVAADLCTLDSSETASNAYQSSSVYIHVTDSEGLI